MESWLKYWWINWCFIMQDFVKPWRQPDFVLSCIHWLGLELIRAPQVVEGSLQLRFGESGKLSPAMWCHWCACAIDLSTAWMKHCMTQYDYLWKYMNIYDCLWLWLSDSPDWRWFNGKKIWHYDQCDCTNKDIPIITDACFSSVDLKHS